MNTLKESVTGRRGRRGAARGAHRHAARRRHHAACRGRCARGAEAPSSRRRSRWSSPTCKCRVPSGYELLSAIKRLRADLPVVLMTAYGTIAQAVSAMREGATDYIVKPFDAQALIDMARRQLAARTAPNDLVAADPESKRTVSLARKIAENDATVLITGESGTGKEVYARFIRDHSARAATSPSSPSTARRFPTTCSRPRCSATRRARSRARSRRMPANSSKRRAARCCSMRSPKWIWGCRPRSCAFCRSARSSASAAAAPSASTCA